MNYFLGSGAIVRESGSDRVRGLTTALHEE
jgi:uncharacterized membrane protein YhiD involved in acid resistance